MNGPVAEWITRRPPKPEIVGSNPTEPAKYFNQKGFILYWLSLIGDVLPRVARWKSLLDEYPEFNRWYENLARGSRITADENARVLRARLISM